MLRQFPTHLLALVADHEIALPLARASRTQAHLVFHGRAKPPGVDLWKKKNARRKPVEKKHARRKPVEKKHARRKPVEKNNLQGESGHTC